MLAAAANRVHVANYRIVNLDCVVAAERPRLADYYDAIRHRIAGILGTSPFQIGLKAKSGEGVGLVGEGELIEARCVALLAEVTT
jgi:2-C-methyl-D-erythritol 2,4-cyclodiphosphate synthase